MNKKTLDLIKKHKIEYVDMRFADLLSTHHHITIPISELKSTMALGKTIDGSSIPGWKGIEDSDMVLKIDESTAFVDPFYERPTLNLICDIHDPTGKNYNRCPRSLSKRAMSVLKKSGIADTALFGPELEFFVFDNIRWDSSMGHSFYEIESNEADWGTGDEDTIEPNGHRPGIKGGYFPVPPVDSLSDFRSEVCNVCASVGIEPEVHHHEVGTAGQCEIGTAPGDACVRADMNMNFKYIVRNVARAHGKVATFMAKPLSGDNGSGMHIHHSLVKKGKNLFAGKDYSGLSKMAMHYIGGIIKHSRALNAFANPTTNSYKRLIPGYEAPTVLGYAARNRSIAVRIPHVPDPKAARFEMRFPDPTANPYLTFAATICAGLDGIRNKIDPGKPSEANMYDLTEREVSKRPRVCSTLNDALLELDKDRKFLTKDGIFDDDLVDGYIDLKFEESRKFRSCPHPIEFDMYFSS